MKNKKLRKCCASISIIAIMLNRTKVVSRELIRYNSISKTIVLLHFSVYLKNVSINYIRTNYTTIIIYWSIRCVIVTTKRDILYNYPYKISLIIITMSL